MLGLVLVAAVLRAARWAATEAMFNDGPAFLDLAQAMEAGEWHRALAHPYHPLYPFVTCVAHVLAGSPAGPGAWERAGAWVSIAAGTASVPLLYAILRRLFDARVAALGALILAVHPTAVRHSSDVQSDGLYLALFLAASLFSWIALAGRRAGAAALAGVLTGLAYLTRPEGLGVALVAAALVGLEVLRRRWRVGDAARVGAALAVGALLAMGPYLVAVHADTGTWQLTKKKSVARLAGVAEPYPVPEDEAAAPSPDAPAGAAAPAHAGPAKRLARATGELVSESVASLRYELVVLLMAGIASRWGLPGCVGRFVGANALLYGAVLFGLALNAGYVSKRHVLPPATLAFGYAALGIPVLGGALLRAGRRVLRRGVAAGAAPAAPVLATALGLALVLPFEVGKNLTGNRDASGAERQAAEWLRDQPGERGAVAADKVRVAWYAGAPFVSLRDAGSEPLVPWLRARGARYLISDAKALSRQPALAAAASELPLLHEVRVHGDVARVFAVTDPEAPDRSAP